MNEPLKIPKFQTEAEEAEWYPQNEAAILQEFERAAANGTLRRGTAKRSSSQPVTLRLDSSDPELAKTLAARRGLAYQSYVKMLLHVALAREAEQGRAQGAPLPFLWVGVYHF